MITRDGSKAKDEVFWKTEDGETMLKIVNAKNMYPYRVGEFVKFQDTLFEILDITWEMIDDNSVRRIITIKIHGVV